MYSQEYVGKEPLYRHKSRTTAAQPVADPGGTGGTYSQQLKEKKCDCVNDSFSLLNMSKYLLSGVSDVAKYYFREPYSTEHR